jgi:plastocyanin
MLRAVAVLSVAVVVACGGGEPASTTVTSTTAAQPAITTTTMSPIDVELTDGEVFGPATFSVAVGDTVDIWVLSDVDDEMHVHGYELVHQLEAGVPFHLSFLADVPGIFEVEVHTGHTLLFKVEVSG